MANTPNAACTLELCPQITYGVADASSLAENIDALQRFSETRNLKRMVELAPGLAGGTELKAPQGCLCLPLRSAVLRSRPAWSRQWCNCLSSA
jgi:hypothetical protein